MKNRSFEIGVLISIFVITLIGVGLYLVVDLYNKSKSYVIVSNPYSILVCTKWDCNDESDKLSTYNNKDYNIYLDGKYLGINSLYYNSGSKKFYVFKEDSAKSIYDNKSRIFAYSGKAKITQYNFDIRDATSSEISEVLSNLSIEVSDSIFSSVVSMDFDGDNSEEKIIILSDMGGMDESVYFSVLAYQDNGKISILNQVSSKDMFSVTYDSVNNVVDIFNDKKLEFIVTRKYRDNLGYSNILYRLKGKKFVNVNEFEVIND